MPGTQAPSAWAVTEVQVLRGFAVEWLETGMLLLSRRHRLYRATGPGAPLQPVASLAAPLWRRAASRLRPAQRLLRALVYNVVPLPDGSLFVTFDRGVGIVRDGHYRGLTGLLRPCRVLRGAAARDDAGRIYFGEYLSNPERGPLRVYRYVPGAAEVEVVHEFPPRSIRHIHGIYHDPHARKLWCLTGDFGDECRILSTEDGFRNIETFGAGGESWRCVSLLFTETSLCYATDAEFERNRVYRVERATGKREVLGELDGPTYYTYAHGEDFFFGVVAELCPSQEGRAAALWRLDRHGRLERVAAFAKDRLPVGWFLPGTLHFPGGPGLPDGFYFHGVGLRGADNRTFRVARVD